MNKNRFVKELKDYFSIFASFLIIFVLFSNNMSFAAASCSDIGDFTKREHCRDYGKKPFTVGIVDIDGNVPITCKGVSLDYNPYTSDDYYYDSSNNWCLAWALGISISYSALSVAASFACTVAGAQTQTGPLTQKAAKLEKLRKAFDVTKKVIQGTVQVAQATALSALTDPVIALQVDFAIDAAITGVILGINIASCAGSLGTAANACASAATCGGMLAALAAASQTLIFATTGGLYETAKDQINKVKVCGYDWNTYAYTKYDMQQPEDEWYPQYGSFSNSYSYAVDKIIKGEYSCVGYLKDDNGGKDNVKLNADAARCDAQSSSCEKEINDCIDKQKKNNYGSVKIDECLVESSSCSAYCKGYFAKCKPIMGILDDGDGVCKDNNGSLYDKDNNKDLFKCKDVKSNYKISRNKFYRESIYKGKEFKIAVKYNDSSDCIDPRLDSQKGYAGLEQRYYFRGKEAAQYACNRFKYTYNGCRLSDGTVITREEAAVDPAKDLKCRQAFQDANSCCQNRRALGICIYNSSGDKSDRDNNALCMRSLDGKADTCGLSTGHINPPKFIAYSGEADSTQICVKNVNYCPYTYNVSGGTELQELYCAGDNNCTNCVKETSKEYRYTIPLCDDKDTIWKKGRYKYPTMAYGNIKNFCRYRAHCTEIGESDYEFTDMTGNKFLPKVCSDFVGDSQNLPYPVKVADISMGGSVKSIIRPSGVDFSLGEYRGFTAPIAQCIKETLSNMFLNKAGQSICAKEGEGVNSEGLCGNDTFGPPENIRKDAYIQMVGEQLPEDSNIFYKIQTRLQTIIKIVAALAIFVIGLKFLMKGDLDIFDIKKPKALIVGMLKFAIVFYFAVGNAWQSRFYEWVDKATQYIYYKSFNLSLVGYQDYKNQADKTTCKVITRSKFCKDYTYQETVLIENPKETCKKFSYTGGVQEFKVPFGVSELTMKVWGASGSTSDEYSGKGGYSYGVYRNVKEGDIFYVYVGGSNDNTGNNKFYNSAWNGGGAGGIETKNGNSGGGATDIRISKGALTCDSSDPRLIVAGGGGGAPYNGTSSYYGGDGGGGNNNGEDGAKVHGGNQGRVDGVLGSSGKYTGTSYAGMYNRYISNSGKTYWTGNYGSCGQGGNGSLKWETSTIAYGGGGGGGGWYGGSGGGSTGAESNRSGGGGGSGYISSSLINSGGKNGVNQGHGKAEICYVVKEEIKNKTGTYCDYDITSTENNKLIENLSEIPSPMPTTSEEICTTYLAGTTEEYKKCYSGCKTGPAYDENGNQVFDYSDTYDGCYFGDNVYPEGKSYLAIFDSLDCKLMNYFGYGPDVDLPGILHMLLISLIFSPLAVVTVILGSILFVILLVIVIKILYLFLMTMIAINIMIYVSPIIFPTLLFEKYKGVFTKWLDNLLSFCLQFVFVIIFAGFLIGNLDRFAIGSAKWVGHDRTTGRLPTLVCGDAVDSIVCIFQVNTNKGTKPMLGEKISKFLGIGPVVSLIDSISKDFSGTVMTLLKFCLITYVLLEFLKKIPTVAAELTNGTALDPGQLDVKEIMGKIKDTTETVTRGATGALKKGAKSLGGLKKKAGETRDKIKEARTAGEAMKDKKFGGKENDGDNNGGGLEKLGVKKQDSGSTPKPPVTPPTSSN